MSHVLTRLYKAVMYPFADSPPIGPICWIERAQISCYAGLWSECWISLWLSGTSFCHHPRSKYIVVVCTEAVEKCTYSVLIALLV